jgi:outer membrane protein assembly factor BamB
VNWTQLSTSELPNVLGTVDGKLLVSFDAGEVTALEIDGGRTQWTRKLSETANNVLLDGHGTLVYAANPGGIIEAYNLSDLEDRDLVPPIEPAWSIELDVAGIYDLIEFPQGGLVAFFRSGMAAISNSGRLLWSSEPATGITDWAQTEEALVFLARDGVWVADEQGASQLDETIDGQSIVASNRPFIYAEDGVYRIDRELAAVELFFALPSGFPRSGSITEMPGSGILVAHTDLDDKRLLAIDQEGSLLWERSIASLGTRAVQLQILNDEIYLMTQYDIGRYPGIDVFHVDAESGELTRIFSGGTRSTSPNPAAMKTTGDSILISIAGVGLSVLDPQIAQEAVLGE